MSSAAVDAATLLHCDMAESNVRSRPMFKGDEP